MSDVEVDLTGVLLLKQFLIESFALRLGSSCEFVEDPENPLAFRSEAAPARPIAVEKLDPERMLCVSDDSPSLAVRHVDVLRRCIQGTEFLDSVTEIGDPRAE